MIFEWDPAKNLLNKRKHGVLFEEAESAFLDDYARLISDPEHSEDEDRFVLLGMSSSLRLLVVVHTYRKDNEVVRIISARKASRIESRTYEEFIK
jgi:uncharacterized DUF497 family protein